ncbi:bifunctional diaminohydroxyphosphoribosylaminopyrimidine deaminase/5-amino-6-(5-phosphoribosylamino)uracil reductase RibD [Candidatus Blochmannia vicinus (nom. nud.)]|uniref:Riboflavin biosynthesis protein RibD n=1 Tax=Candidatus Blochmannia vicinus (nom. nud.) TaxID=251540 RepID=A0A9Q8TWI2_9ENTR|nr:bifunctional diaminohydroxyphosphoribosylaminopyrimidine deaminase/5-amino-6-(5-phosphoribosylamino)uracil reductase RibD [Candidatus Blochmannia vicinus]URJ27960.1 bifunctional diaminohydroxyphosphoribosylaminopyrimidine deaminase/5-amino-6-(5-phosphoribosylamino)uracil reductase RibD [Candidatus Blochmannia vicinus]URJ30768.1 bifunctional diaminohydroxyphosphoribosylaminopyrimidine deaminase/5-amino-6-(5-phosphoribosylamino)uracil reductase RibD [Candidatus Blochmannia vicinus]
MLHDKKYLKRALQLAWKGRFTTMPNPNVGCVIVHNNKIVGEGYHIRTGEAHAEIHALRVAGNLSKGATAYITLEPCSHYGRTPPCTSALINAGIKRVVVAMLDPHFYARGRGLHLLKQAGIEVRHNSLMLSEAESINRGFIKRIRTGLPWVKLKLAASLDGRTAMSSGESKWITSVQARQDVQHFRAESDVILSTANTVLADNPKLNVRWSCFSDEIKYIYANNKIRQPLRVIIDSTNRVLPTHRVIRYEGKILLVRLKKDHRNWPPTVEQLLLPSINYCGHRRVNLRELMQYLAYREINNVWVEAGATFSGILLDIGLVDELILYQAIKFLGSDARPLCLLPNIKCLNDIKSFDLIDIKNIGPDIRLRLIPKNI